MCKMEMETYGRFDSDLEMKAELYNTGSKKWCSGPRVVIFLFLFIVLALLSGLIAFFILDANSSAGNDKEHSEVVSLRINCIPEWPERIKEVNLDMCLARGCIYNPVDDLAVPACYINANTSYGYKYLSHIESDEGIVFNLEALGTGIFGEMVPKIRFHVEYHGDDIIRFKFDDVDPNKRYKVPILLNTSPAVSMRPRYVFEMTNSEPFSFKVKRASTGTVLFDTQPGGLTFSDQFLQISTLLPSENIYGFGENVHHQFRHDLNYRTWSLFARDQPPSTDQTHNLYSSHPFYECLEKDGNAHGVLLYTSNAMEYSFTPAPMLTYRTIGGILDFYIFLGPTPEAVVKQYHGVIGKPFLPPYWSLGFHLSRYGYKDTEDMKGALERTVDNEIPIDCQHADIDYMDRKRSFTIDPEKFYDLPDYFSDIKKKGVRNIVILDPCLEINDTYHAYTLGKENDIYVKWPNKEIMPTGDYEEYESTDMMGFVWPEWKVVFPDFFNPNAGQVWTELLNQLKEVVDYDGLWLDMNEPANFDTNGDKPWNWPDYRTEDPWTLKCPQTKNEDPPYPTRAAFLFDAENWTGRLSDKTLCMEGVFNNSYKHYDVHNLYGHSQTKATFSGMRSILEGKKRGMVISRSTFPGDGQFAGKWLGDNSATWKDLQVSVVGMLEFNLFGIPFVGSDICGYFGDTTEELCSRWMQLGAFYPFSRNHNQEMYKDQDPGALGETVIQISREALQTRYLLLPYLYTLFYQVNRNGGTIVRPLFHEFFFDSNTWDIDEQFLWGPALLISPILHEGVSEHTYYIPKGNWYDFYSGISVDQEATYQKQEVELKSQIPLHIRGGHIIPLQLPSNNTFYSRQNKFGLKVAMSEVDGALSVRDSIAHGSLFWDDGETIGSYDNQAYHRSDFFCRQNKLDVTVYLDNTEELVLGFIEVFGVLSPVQYVYINGNNPWTNFSYNSSTQVLIISDLEIPMTESFNIDWSEKSHAIIESDQDRIDCCPEGCDAGQRQCEEKGCIWQSSTADDVPWCFINISTYGYVSEQDTINDSLDIYNLTWKRQSSMYGDDVLHSTFALEYFNNGLHIKMTDSDNERYEVDLELIMTKLIDGSSADIEFNVVDHDPFSFEVRRSTGELIWDTSIGGMTFSKYFLQIAARTECNNIYGFGEQEHPSLKHNMNHVKWGMFSRDQPPSPGSNLYSVHPFYLCVENDGRAHAVLLLNSNAQEVQLQPNSGIIYRTLGGIFDFYFMVGDSPEQVIQQYHRLIGFPMLPAYWSLGFHLSRYGYNNIANLENVIDRNIAAGIPYDGQFLDIDIMDKRKDFTLDTVNFAGLPELIERMKQQGIRVSMILDPFIVSNETDYFPYDEGLQRGVFISWPEGESPDYEINKNDFMLGFAWPEGKTVFPDFHHPNTSDYWVDLIEKYYNEQFHFDSIWLDMCEPANFGTNEEKPWNWPDDYYPYWSLKCPMESFYETPPYKPASIWGSQLSDKTICMIAEHKNGQLKHYDVHNLHALQESYPTVKAVQKVTGKRGLVLARSTYPSSGKYVGKWLGDNASMWGHLKLSIIGSLEFNLFGVPLIGADICGYFNDCPQELCIRWHQLGAFYTFSRNHNGINYADQDPAAFGTDVVEPVKAVLNTKYELLPYLYTLFYDSHTKGGTVMRSLINEFPYDMNSAGIDRQFLWGHALLISPVLDENTFEIHAYFPANNRWFDYFTGQEISHPGESHLVAAPIDQIPLHLRGGYVILTQEPAVNTVLSRKNNFGLTAAPNATEEASGHLFWDDGESIDTVEQGQYYLANFFYSTGQLSLELVHNDATVTPDMILDTIRVFGVFSKPTSVEKPSTSGVIINYNEITKEMILKNLQVNMAESFTITWQ